MPNVQETNTLGYERPVHRWIPYLQYITARLADNQPLECFPSASLEARVQEACDHFAEDNVRPRCWRAIGERLGSLPNRFERWSESSERFYYMSKHYFTKPNVTKAAVVERYQLTDGALTSGAFTSRLQRFFRQWNYNHGQYVCIDDRGHGQYEVTYARLDKLDENGRIDIENVSYSSAHSMYLAVEEYLKAFNARFTVPMEIELTRDGREIAEIHALKERLSELEAKKTQREISIKQRRDTFSTCSSTAEEDTYLGHLLVRRIPYTHLMEISGLTRGDLVRRFHSAMKRWNLSAVQEGRYWIKPVGGTLTPDYHICRGTESVRYGYSYRSLIDAFEKLREYYKAAGQDVDEYFRP